MDMFFTKELWKIEDGAAVFIWWTGDCRVEDQEKHGPGDIIFQIGLHLT